MVIPYSHVSDSIRLGTLVLWAVHLTALTAKSYSYK